MTRYAKLDNNEVARLNEYEEKMGNILLAVEEEPTVATLSQETLKIIQDLEPKIGVKLVAYE